MPLFRERTNILTERAVCRYSFDNTFSVPVWSLKYSPHPLLWSTLSQFNPPAILTNHFTAIHPYIVFPHRSMPPSPKHYLSQFTHPCYSHTGCKIRLWRFSFLTFSTLLSYFLSHFHRNEFQRLRFCVVPPLTSVMASVPLPRWDD
jgi:hypothetical protein